MVNYIVSLLDRWMIIPFTLSQKLTYMVLNTFKTFSSCDVVDCNTSMCISKISLRNGPEPFLPRSIPNLNLYDFLVNLQRLYFEIHSNSTWSCAKDIVSKSQEQTCLPHICVTNEHNLVKCFKVLRIESCRIFQNPWSD